MSLQTPFYLMDIAALRRNMDIVARLRDASGAKALLALKCFATWSVFDQMRDYMDGTTSSSLYELRLGREKFGKETHAYSVAWADHEIDEALGYADKIIFNSLGQLDRFADRAQGITRGHGLKGLCLLRVRNGFRRLLAVLHGVLPGHASALPCRPCPLPWAWAGVHSSASS